MPMVVEITRLVLGLMIAVFHRPLANFVMERERSLVVLFRSRGLAFPPLPRSELVHDVYFAGGIFIAVIELARIWALVR
jgi:hypothetical protein